ncbi:MAG: WD40 repeat protein [Planctomycetota bacterium]|jgi:WD40 repeat protein
MRLEPFQGFEEEARNRKHTPDAVLLGHVGPAYCVAFTPDGSPLATGGGDGTIRI